MEKQRNNIEVNREKEIADIQKRIEELEDEIRRLDVICAAAQMDHEELFELYRRKLDLGKELDSAMELWVELAE